MMDAIRIGVLASMMWFYVVAHSYSNLKQAEELDLRFWHQMRLTCPVAEAKP